MTDSDTSPREDPDSSGAPGLASTEDLSPEAPIWGALQRMASTMATRSYSPYSQFAVGAAALTTSGTIVTGCNVENVSYGLTLCAECGLVSNLVAENAGQLTALVVVSGSGAYCTPCGRCRQLLVEHAAPGALIQTEDGIETIQSLLPGSFTLDRLREG